MTVYGKDFGEEVGGVDEAGKEYKAEEMLVSEYRCYGLATL